MTNEIKTRVPSKEYKDGWDRIFGTKSENVVGPHVESGEIRVQEEVQSPPKPKEEAGY